MNYKFCTKKFENENENDNENENKSKKKIFNNIIKMSYYQFNRQEILQKAKEKYSKEKAAEYYLQNKEALKE